MEDFSIQKLKTEITTDPVGRRYSGRTNGDIWTLLNDVTYTTGFKPVESKDLLVWAADNGRYEAIKKGSELSSSSNTIRAVCHIAMKLIDRADVVLDLNNADQLRMMRALVFANILTTSDRDALQILCTFNICRAEELWGRKVTIDEIREAVK